MHDKIQTPIISLFTRSGPHAAMLTIRRYVECHEDGTLRPPFQYMYLKYEKFTFRKRKINLHLTSNEKAFSTCCLHDVSRIYAFSAWACTRFYQSNLINFIKWNGLHSKN